jgi:Delta3-Delta2-enoyl-CoA isomerase
VQTHKAFSRRRDVADYVENRPWFALSSQLKPPPSSGSFEKRLCLALDQLQSLVLDGHLASPQRRLLRMGPMNSATPIEITHDGAVTVVRMTANENRFNPTMIGALNDALDGVEATEGPAAVVLTGTGKFFSNGLDLDWMGTVTPEEATASVQSVQVLLARVLTSPVAVVAALNGHVFAAGAMLALACDQRVMREDRGFFCLPEVDINIPFTPGMSALIQSVLPTATARESMLTGRRYSGPEALGAGIIAATATEEDVLSEAVRMAEALAAKNRRVVGQIKAEMYANVVSKLMTLV